VLRGPRHGTANEKSSIIANRSRPRAFQRAIDKVRTLPLTPQGLARKANLSFKNRFLYISGIDEASDFKFGMQLGFAKADHKITPGGKVGVALG